MTIFKTKTFARFARKEGIGNTNLSAAVVDIEKGLYEADLGGGVIKKRVARSGEGKRGGYRTAVAYCEGKRTVFLHGFPKNDKGNFTVLEVEELKEFAKLYLLLSDADIKKALKAGKIEEVTYGKEKI